MCGSVVTGKIVSPKYKTKMVIRCSVILLNDETWKENKPFGWHARSSQTTKIPNTCVGIQESIEKHRTAYEAGRN